MKLLSCLSCTNPDADAASYGVIEITKDDAAKILALHAKVRAFLLDVAEGGVLSRHVSPNFGLSGHWFTALRYSEELESVETAHSDEAMERLVILPEGAPLPEIPDDGADSEERMDLFRILFGEDHVRLAGRSKHGDYWLEAERIPLELLRRIAQG